MPWHHVPGAMTTALLYPTYWTTKTQLSGHLSFAGNTSSAFNATWNSAFLSLQSPSIPVDTLQKMLREPL
jgi:hypothetical protein